MFAELVDYIQQNPLIILLACYLAYSFWRARQPIAEPGDVSHPRALRPIVCTEGNEELLRSPFLQRARKFGSSKHVKNGPQHTSLHAQAAPCLW